MQYKVSNNTLYLILSKALYSQDVIFKCFYWYGDNYDVEILDDIDNVYKVNLKSKEPLQEDELISKIKRDLIDFKLRDIITKETQTIRELLVAKAFAHFDFESLTELGEITDPVGFDPTSIDQ